jgi:hypothetical protein
VGGTIGCGAQSSVVRSRLASNTARRAASFQNATDEKLATFLRKPLELEPGPHHRLLGHHDFGRRRRDR